MSVTALAMIIEIDEFGKCLNVNFIKYSIVMNDNYVSLVLLLKS